MDADGDGFVSPEEMKEHFREHKRGPQGHKGDRKKDDRKKGGRDTEDRQKGGPRPGQESGGRQPKE